MRQHKMKIVTIINGQGGDGKDTFVEQIVEYCKSKHTHVFIKNVSTVDKVKQAAKLLGWDGHSKNNEDRKFLSDLKDLAIDYSDHSYSYIFDLVFSETGIVYSEADTIMFVHCREPEEITKLKEGLDNITVRTVLVNRDTDEVYTNHSDNNVYNFKYDFVIDNNGTLDDLEYHAKEFVDDIIESYDDNECQVTL